MQKFEKLILGFLLYIVSLGTIVSYINIELFEQHFAKEDKTIEWLTFTILIALSVICFRRVKRLKAKKSKIFAIGTTFMAFLFLFGAGEEASWGQRQLKFEVPQFFKEHNSQKEANIHNLTFGDGKKINKIVFGTGLGIFVSLFLLVLPYYYRRNKKLAELIDKAGIPIAQNHHVICYIILFLVTSLIPTGRKGELLEFGGVSIFLLILLYPQNSRAFR